MLTEREQHRLTDRLDEWVSSGPGKMFTSRPVESEEAKKRLRKIHRKLHKACHEIESRRLKGAICRPSCALYDAMVYKFGLSNRHQKFWRITLQIRRELRRLNQQDIAGPFTQLTQRLERSRFAYAPSKRTVRYCGALLLRRIFHLDKLRLICAHSADRSMGYIELRHFLTFNLMTIAIASDVAAEARRQMQQLATIYDDLGVCFHRNSPWLPSSTGMLKFKSLALLDTEGRREVKQLKKHDLALLRKEIEGFGQNQVEAQGEENGDFGSPIGGVDQLLAAGNPTTPATTNITAAMDGRKALLKRRKPRRGEEKSH